jgi:hypothetical protein
MRRAIAVGQIVAQSDEASVGFWLRRDAEGAIDAQAAADEPPGRGRRAGDRPVRVIRKGRSQ